MNAINRVDILPREGKASLNQTELNIWSAGAVLLFGVHVFVILFATGIDDTLRLAIDNAILISAGMLAFGLLFAACQSYSVIAPRLGISLRFLAAAQAFYLAGDITWGVFEVILRRDPIPSLADIGYFAYYSFALAGILTLPSRAMTRMDWVKIAIDMAVVMISSGLLVSVFLVFPLLAFAGFESPLALLIKLLYPIFDLVLLWAIGVMLMRQVRLTVPLMLYACGVAVLCVADALFAYLDLQGLYESGSSIADVLFPLSILLVSLSAGSILRRTRNGKSESAEPIPASALGSQRLAIMRALVPYFWVIVAFAMLVYQVTSSDIDGDKFFVGFTVLGFGLILTCVLLRQSLALYENVRLSHRQQDLIDSSHILARPLDLGAGADRILVELNRLIPNDESFLLLKSRISSDVIVAGSKSWTKAERVSTHMAESAAVREVLQLTQPIVVLESSAPQNLPRETLNAVLRLFDESRHMLWPKRALTPILTWALAPLISGGNVIGVLFLGYIDETPRALDQLDLIASFARQATASVENARLRQQQVFAAATRERAKLSRNLHDSVLQSLYSLALGLRTAQHYLAGTDSPAREPLEYSLQLADSAQAEMRALVLELRPETLENEGLVVALNRQAQVLCERKGIALHVITTPEPAIPFEHKEMLYRIAIEGIQNAVKHACATCVDLALQDTSGGIRMSIVDNGVGFDPGQNYAGHVGLISMRERAAESGALLQIDSKPGHGTRVIIDMPLIATEGARAVQRPA